jgi:hypothetical protein
MTARLTDAIAGIKEPWKLAERTAFLRCLQQANCTRLLEIGAGTGQDSVFFASHGLDIVATDMSAACIGDLPPLCPPAPTGEFRACRFREPAIGRRPPSGLITLTPDTERM